MGDDAPEVQLSKDSERALRALNKHRTIIELNINTIKTDLNSDSVNAELNLELINTISDSVHEFCKDERDSLDEDCPQLFNSGFGLLKAVTELKQRVSKLIKKPDNAVAQPVVNVPSFGAQVKLPDIQLPTFDGNHREWFSFKDSFNSLIGNKLDLSALHKFQYLKASLRGEAARTIQSLEITELNYPIAVQLLRDNFENKRMIVNSHIQALFNLPYIRKETSSEYRDLINAVMQNTRSLESLERPVESTEDWLIYLILTHCPQSFRVEWENQQTDNSKMPTFDELKKCLSKRCQTLESISGSIESAKVKTFSSNNLNSCCLCSQEHQLFNCDKFRAFDTNKRLELVRSKRLCRNCLKSGHNTIDCNSTRHCKTCNKRHNTLLHFTQQSDNSLHVNNSSHDTVLLSTCILEVTDGYGKKHNIRALLDSGSQLNLITRKFVRKLNLRTYNTNQTFSGIGSTKCATQAYVDLNLGSKISNFNSNVRCFTVDRITNQLPNAQINVNQIEIPKDVALADPQFYKPADIDLLLGVELLNNLLKADRIFINDKKLVLQNTHAGWIISGKVPFALPNLNLICHSVTYSQLNSNIKRFWEIENIEPAIPIKSKEEMQCEEYFCKSVERDVDGRFIVALPWKTNPSALGDSYGSAKKRLLNLEYKLQRHPELRHQYMSFMNEYVNLGHMKRSSFSSNNIGYFLPHHSVIKNSSLTTKLRVVFDASAKSYDKISLNDLLLTGPTLQDDLFEILVRFRTHEYVITADIQMMYRQIKIRDSDCKYQQILWRQSPNQPIQVYQLQTVTYGTCCAPYLAVRCLQELAREAPDIITSEVIIRDFYMDDVLTGASTIKAARKLRDALSNTLKKGGFPLRKWAANNKQIINDLNNSQISNHVLNLAPDEQIKALGVQWNPNNDQIEYNSFHCNTASTTKRTILSEISKYFDPLGLVGPVIIVAKLLLQRIWKLQLKWDEQVPKDILDSWLQLRGELNTMQTIKTARKAKSSPNAIVELHAFGDASMDAYGSAIYLKSLEPDGSTFCTLLCAKSKVAPLKSISLPRLELCAAVLTANLVERVKKSLREEISQYYYYTDSTIVLSWLNTEANRFKQFVSHRIGEIQRLTNIEKWLHIRSGDNPADIISRGTLPSELINNRLWWHGPEFLKHKSIPQQFIPNLEHSAELRALIITKSDSKPNIPWINKYSKFNRLVRVTGWIQRFIHNYFTKGNRATGELSFDELNKAETLIIKSVQMAAFSREIELLKQNKSVDSHSKLLQLNPFLDEFGIIRVGGRLRYSKLLYDSKFPIVLPKSSFLTVIIIRHYHCQNFHIGPQGTLASIRTKYWPISGRNIVRRITRECVTCFKANPRSSEPIMGNLPEYRAERLRPFTKTGIDYGGPFLIKEGKRKMAKLVKVYLALFICMSTKAVHLEIVSDLTTESFLAALRRFISRRGVVTDLYSDNATTFVGANNEMKKLYNFLREQQEELKSELSKDRINWHFIPARAPHFGGLWEAGIKSTKRHLFKIATNASLTYEELWTLLVQIEAILNSRPLCPLSNDPSDLSFLTPGHFLVGGNLKALPEPNLEEIKIGRLSRWQLVQRIQQHFWARWHKEYLQELQGRHKWKQSKGQPLIAGQLVLIHEDNAPASRWRVGRIEAVHPGGDGVVRSATVKTASDRLTRPAVKLYALPLEKELDDSVI